MKGRYFLVIRSVHFFSSKVPFFPIVLKDLSFLHFGNKSKVDGLVSGNETLLEFSGFFVFIPSKYFVKVAVECFFYEHKDAGSYRSILRL